MITFLQGSKARHREGKELVGSYRARKGLGKP